MNCYCGMARPYQECCQPYHLGTKPAATAEQLMRSRFSAYFLQLVPYIAKTYYPAQQSADAIVEIADFARHARFVSLEVLSADSHTSVDPKLFSPLAAAAATFETSFVHFKVSFLLADKLHLLEEHSRFVREQQEWRYVDGVLLPHPVHKIGRNDSCPCASGKKFKACNPHWLNGQPV